MRMLASVPATFSTMSRKCLMAGEVPHIISDTAVMVGFFFLVFW